MNPTGRSGPAHGRFRPASPTTAMVLGGLGLVLAIAFPPLVVLAHQLTLSNVATPLLLQLPFLAVGLVVARRQPRNPVGWIFLAGIDVTLLSGDCAHYAWVVYGLGHRALPLGSVAVSLSGGGALVAAFIPIAIIVFPNGRVPSPRWRWALWFNVYGLALWTACVVAAVTIDRVEHGIHDVGSPGGLGVDPVLASPTGWFADVDHVATPLLLVLWLVAAASQVANWRASTGELRRQLKCLVVGSAVCLVSIGILASGTANGGSSLVEQVWSQVPWVCFSAVPIAIGVGILRYRLYEIDRLVSRTISYAILTGLLAGVFVAIVALATRVLPFSSPVAVAASTLAAAALFNPLRRRVQHLVDRRFNRAGYDAEATIAAFTSQLRDAVDLDTVRQALLHAVDRAVEPTHASIWIRPPRS